MCTYECTCTHVYVQHNRKNRKHRREQNIVHALITFTCIHFWFWSIYPGIHSGVPPRPLLDKEQRDQITASSLPVHRYRYTYFQGTCSIYYMYICVHTPPRYNNNRAITVPPLPTKNHPTYLLILDTKSNHPRPNGVGCRPRVFSRTAPF